MDKVLKAFEAAFGVWTTTGYFKHKPTQHQLDGFRKGYAIAEQASADRIAKLEQHSVDNLLLREGGYPHLPESNSKVSTSQVQQQDSQPSKELFGLYKSCNELVAHIGMVGNVESDNLLVDAVMNALHDLDGGNVANRVDDLIEKAFMPRTQALKLAANEYISKESK